jgi:hypothetical protein
MFFLLLNTFLSGHVFSTICLDESDKKELFGDPKQKNLKNKFSKLKKNFNYRYSLMKVIINDSEVFCEFKDIIL